jgi:hypothetical protein
MDEKKNLVKDFLLEQKIIDPDKIMYDYFYEDIEWFAYKLSDDTMRYVSYELTPHGLGYAFCVTIKLDRLTYNFEPVYYSKSFTNDTKGEWTTVSDKFRNKLISDAMMDLDIWNK